MSIPLLVLSVMLLRQPADIDLSLAKSYFDQAAALSKADGGKLWGKPLDGPLMFVDPRTMKLVANQGDKESKLAKQGEVWVGQLPNSIAPANHAFDWSGVHWTMVMWPLPELPNSRGRLVMHECFHRIQDSLGLPASNPNCSHLDEKDGRIWLRLEMRALAEALSQSGGARKEAILDALRCRTQRAKLCGDDAKKAELMLEMNEGLAEYTGLVLSGFGKPSWEARAAVRLEQEQSNPTFARSFAYATGPAYGLLLDSLGVKWREGLDPKSSLPELLAKAVRYEPAFSNLDLARLERYGASRVMAVETEQAVRRAAKIEGFNKLFLDGPVLELPVAGQFSFSYDPNGVDSLPGVGQVFDSAKITDEWGVLEVQSGGVLMKRPKEMFTGVVVAKPVATADGARGEGWTLRLNPGWKLKPGAKEGSFEVVKG